MFEYMRLFPFVQYIYLKISNFGRDKSADEDSATKLILFLYKNAPTIKPRIVSFNTDYRVYDIELRTKNRKLYFDSKQEELIANLKYIKSHANKTLLNTKLGGFKEFTKFKL
jgi:hypothetical protein